MLIIIPNGIHERILSPLCMHAPSTMFQPLQKPVVFRQAESISFTHEDSLFGNKATILNNTSKEKKIEQVRHNWETSRERADIKVQLFHLLLFSENWSTPHMAK